MDPFKGLPMDPIKGFGMYSFIIASFFWNSDIIELLLEKGADANIQDNDGYTALIWAVQKGDLQIVRLLLEAGAEVNIQNNMGDTALIWGTRIVYPDGLRGNPANKRYQIVRSLLDAGANPNIRNNAGATAYDVALHHFNNRVANLLRQKMEEFEAATRFQSRIRGKQTRRRIRTQTAKQNLAFTKGLEDRPLIYGRHVRYEPNIDQLISEKLSSMSYNPEVARRMEEEEKMLPYTDWLQEFSQYGSGKHRRRNRNKKYTRNRFY